MEEENKELEVPEITHTREEMVAELGEEKVSEIEANAVSIDEVEI